jgi:FkbH-like protein
MSHSVEGPPLPVRVAASFACDQLGKAAEHYLGVARRAESHVAKGRDVIFEWAPYGNIVDFIHGSASNGHTSANVVFFRMEDILYSHPELTTPDIPDGAEKLLSALNLHSGAPLILYVCPSSPSKVDMSKQAEDNFRANIQRMALKNVHLVGKTYSFFELFPCFRRPELRAGWYDDKLATTAHAPFTDTAIAAMGQIVVRQAYRCFPHLKSRKVVVLDCDNTLWSSAVGEVGADGVRVETGHRFLQQFFLRLQQRGMLLCLCSRNRAEDVLEVFEARKDDMILSLQDHIVAHRINWGSKVDNINALALQLNVSLESFVFVDDNAGECEMVRSALPTVAVIQVPPTSPDIPSALLHAWALDRPVSAGALITAEDSARTEMYRASSSRQEEMRKWGPRKNAFLASLAIKIVYQVMDTPEVLSKKLPRILQLMERTNQFNASGLRKKQSEIIDAVKREPNWGVSVVSVTDRFGHYGDVGLIFAHRNDPENRLDVDVFLLSCRVLQRGVEHDMLRYVGGISSRAGVTSIHFLFNDLPRNEPIKTFFHSLPDNAYQDQAYIVPVKSALACFPRWSLDTKAETAENKVTVSGQTSPATHNDDANGSDNMFWFESSQLPALKFVSDSICRTLNANENYFKLMHSFKNPENDQLTQRLRGHIRDEVKVYLGESPFDSKKRQQQDDEEARKRKRKREKQERGAMWRKKNAEQQAQAAVNITH